MSYFYDKTYASYVRCVRGEQLASSDLSRNDNTEIVTDSATGLQLQDDSAANDTPIGWGAAVDYCEETLSLGGYTDWRLPNKHELLTIVDRSRKFPSIDISVFQNTDETSASYYWTSTTSTSDNTDAWILRFTIGYSEEYGKNYNCHVRCVRGGEFGHLTCPDGYHLNQGERRCMPGIPDSDPGPYLPLPDRNYIQGDITTDANRTADPGWTGDYPALCRDENSTQGAYDSCP